MQLLDTLICPVRMKPMTSLLKAALCEWIVAVPASLSCMAGLGPCLYNLWQVWKKQKTWVALYALDRSGGGWTAVEPLPRLISGSIQLPVNPMGIFSSKLELDGAGPDLCCRAWHFPAADLKSSTE